MSSPAARGAAPVQSGAMTDTRLWDRAALTVASDGRRLPAVAALPPGTPTVTELFDFMRDAELRFATLRMRILERAVTSRGEEETQVDVMLRHPGDAKVTTSRPGDVAGGQYEIWISDGDIVRTYAAAHKLGTQRPIRNRPRGLHDPDLPGTARVYEPVTGLPMETLPDTFIHPAGYAQNVLATGPCSITGTGEVIGRTAIFLRSDHPRTIEIAGDRPDHRIDIAVDRELGIILRLVERIGGEVTRDAEVTDLGPDALLPPSAFDFVFPTGTTMLY
jgi:outer membrane lipoprotein-sorting protein